MIKEYLESESKQSLMRLITFIMAIVIAIIALGQFTVQIINAAKSDQIFEPNWIGLGIFFGAVVLGKATQKFAEKK